MTTSVPEPYRSQPGGALPGGHLRASDADREQVMTVLSTAYAEGRLTREEHDERLAQVMRARTFDDLVPPTADLMMVASSPSAAAPTPARYDVEGGAAPHEVERMVAVFSGVNRRGKWRIRRHTQALAVFGGMDLDLREAVFEAPVVEITGLWCFGGLDVKVPEGVEVRDEVVGIFGGTDIGDLGEHAPGAPTLVIKGLALFGGVSVKGPRRGRRRR